MLIVKIILGIFISLGVIGLILFIHSIKNAPLYPPDYDI